MFVRVWRREGEAVVILGDSGDEDEGKGGRYAAARRSVSPRERRMESSRWRRGTNTGMVCICTYTQICSLSIKH